MGFIDFLSGLGGSRAWTKTSGGLREWPRAMQIRLANIDWKNNANVWQLSDRNLAPFSTFPFAFRLLWLCGFVAVFFDQIRWNKSTRFVWSLSHRQAAFGHGVVWALISHCSSCVTDVCRFLTDLNVNNDIFYDITMFKCILLWFALKLNLKETNTISLLFVYQMLTANPPKGTMTFQDVLLLHGTLSVHFQVLRM